MSTNIIISRGDSAIDVTSSSASRSLSSMQKMLLETYKVQVGKMQTNQARFVSPW